MAGTFGYVAVVFGPLAAQVAHTVGDEGVGYSARSLLIGLAAGAVAGVAGAVLLLVSWRRWGGQRLVRTGRRVWRTGRLPVALPARMAVLRDLERRDRALDQGPPRFVLAVIWTLFAAVQLWRDPSPPSVVAWSGFVVGVIAVAAADVVDRRRRPALRALIRTIRDDPTGFPPGPSTSMLRS